MKKRILLVDDQISFLRTLKRKINKEYQDIEVAIFGDRKNGIGEIKNNDVGESFIEYLKVNKNEYIADVIFCDFQLENGFTALDILDEANRHSSLPPIVVMTANKNTFFNNESIDSVEKGARGYIIKTDDTVNIGDASKHFIRQIYITTLRVYEEHKQRIANKIITEINEIEILDKDNKEQNNKVEKLAKHFVKTFTKYYPYYTLFVRKYEKDKLKLLATNIKDEDSKKHLKELDVNGNKMLQDVISDGIMENIDMQEFLDSEGNIDEQVKKAIIDENLHKGIIKRVGEQGVPLGTISIYCHKKDRNFDKETINIFSNIIDSVKRDWELIGYNERTTKELEFIEDILYYEDEDSVWQDLCKLIHQQFNEDSATTKTTIKIYNSLTKELERVACEGAACNLDIGTISINNPNISAWVFRNKRFVVLDMDAFKNPNNDKKELKEKFISKLAINGRDENIKYITSNPDMKSELCMPIGYGEKKKEEKEDIDKVLGVLNLESSHNKAYTNSDKKLRKEIELLLKVACKRVENIRLKKFVEMLYALEKEQYEERFKIIKNSLKEFIDFSHFSIIVMDNNRLKIEYIFDKNKIEKKELEEEINKSSAIKNFIENEKEKDFKYIRESSEDKNFNDILNSKSQYIFKMRHNDKVLGIINFEFDRENPLDEDKIKTLKTLIQFLAKDIKENEDFVKLKVESELLLKTMSQIAHSLTRYINLGGFITSFLAIARENGHNIEDCEDLLNNLKIYSYGLMLHVGIPRVIDFASEKGEVKEDMFTYLKNDKFIEKIKNFTKIASEISSVLCENCDDNSLILENLEGSFILNFKERDLSRLTQEYMKYIIFEFVFNAMKAMEHVEKPYIKFYAIEDGICIENRVDENFDIDKLNCSKGTGYDNIKKMIEEQGGKVFPEHNKEENILKIKLIKKEN